MKTRLFFALVCLAFSMWSAHNGHYDKASYQMLIGIFFIVSDRR